MGSASFLEKSHHPVVLKVLLLITSLSVLLPVAAQRQDKIDSLKSQLPGKTDEERADIFYELAYEYTDFNNTLGAEYIKQSFQFAKRTGDSLRIVKAGRIQAAVFRRLEKLDTAIALWLKMLPIALRNSYGEEAKKILRGMALAYTYKARYDLGLHYNFELLKITEQDNDSIEMSYALSNIGVVYFKLTNHKKALQYYHRALDVRSPRDKYSWVNVFQNISLCYSELKNFSKAIEFVEKAREACQPTCQDNFTVYGLRAYGVLHHYKGDLDSAEVYYLKSYSLAKKFGYKRDQLILIADLTGIYLQENKISLAIKCLSEAESIMQETPFGYELVSLYFNFLSFYKKTGDEKKRAFYQEKYILLKDSIYSEALTNNLMKIESEFLERPNKARITEQEQLLVLKDQVIERQRAFNILTGIITVLLIALLYILYRSNLQRRSANRLLDQKVKERTVALELSQLALKQSLEERDMIITRAFCDIKNSATAIKELCSFGLEDEHALEIRERLEKIWTMTWHVSQMLSKMHPVEI